MSDWEPVVRDLARKYALENAVKHGGKANPGAVIGKIMAENPDLRPHAKAIPGVVAGVVATVNAMTTTAQTAAFAEVADQVIQRDKKRDDHPLKPLPDAEPGKVVMRFAPNPSGPATFGHARGMVIHWSYKQRYDGKVILRFDDTDATVKRPMMEAYDWIPEDFEWLCGKPDLVIKASDRMAHYYQAARDVLERGGAYICECDAESFRTLKNAGKACPCRDNEIPTNLERWQGMLDGRYQPGEATLRVKTDITHKDPALRDWVGFRLARDAHPLVGDRYRAWPLLDFQSAVDDHLTGVTHIIRGKDLMDSTRKQKFLYDHFGWQYPHTVYWGRVSVHEFGKFSKSRLNEAIAKGEFSGWDDPRLPTLRALRRRGFTAEGITNFWLGFGITEKDIAASTQTLEAENKKILEPLADRYFFVPEPTALSIDGLTKTQATPARHPDEPARGTRTLSLDPPRVHVASRDLSGVGQALRLKELGNIEVGEDEDGLRATWMGDDLAWAKEHRAPIVQWVPDNGAIRARLVMGDNSHVDGLVESALSHVEEGARVQLERVGFARVDHCGREGIVLYYTHG